MPEPCQTLIHAAMVLTQDERRTRLHDAGIAICDGLIAALGPWAEVAEQFAAETTLDLGESLILPGLINTHTHAAMAMFRGVADDMPLESWLHDRIWPLERGLSDAFVHLGALLACTEMIRTGATCFADMYLFEEATARAVEQSGLRAVLAEGLLDFPTQSYATNAEAFTRMEALFERLQGNPRLRGAVAPHSVYATSPDILTRSFAFAEKHNAVWMLHAAETHAETLECLQRFGKRPLACLDDLGLLAPRTLLIHAVDLDAAELDRVAVTGAMVAHIPKSNMKLASGVAPVTAMHERRIRVGLGTDGAASNNTLNMFSEMTFCALLHKLVERNASVLPAQTVLDMATRRGAACLGWPELGRLERGLPADLVALDLTAPNLLPLYDPVSHVVYAATGDEVRLTMVAGKILYHDGSFTSIDVKALRAEVKQISQKICAALKG